jgi:hypothetical protein
MISILAGVNTSIVHNSEGTARFPQSLQKLANRLPNIPAEGRFE